MSFTLCPPRLSNMFNRFAIQASFIATAHYLVVPETLVIDSPKHTGYFHVFVKMHSSFFFLGNKGEKKWQQNSKMIFFLLPYLDLLLSLFFLSFQMVMFLSFSLARFVPYAAQSVGYLVLAAPQALPEPFRKCQAAAVSTAGRWGLTDRTGCKCTGRWAHSLRSPP